jgi:hypothetical protein
MGDCDPDEMESRSGSLLDNQVAGNRSVMVSRGFGRIMQQIVALVKPSSCVSLRTRASEGLSLVATTLATGTMNLVQPQPGYFGLPFSH